MAHKNRKRSRRASEQMRWPGRNEPGSVCSTDASERETETER